MPPRWNIMLRKGLRSVNGAHDFNTAGHLASGSADFPLPESVRWSCVRWQFVLSRLLEFLPRRDFNACVERYRGSHKCRGFFCRDQFLAMADANQRRDWRIFIDFAHILIRRARVLYAKDPLAVDLEHKAYAMGSTTIDLCLSLFPWARFQTTKAAIRPHTLLEFRGDIPCFVHVSPATMHDVNVKGSRVHRLPPAAAVHNGRRLLGDAGQAESSLHSPGQASR
jgi:hypothetical protein